MDPNYHHKKRNENPQLREWGKEKKKRRTKADFDKEDAAAKTKLFDRKPEADEISEDEEKEAKEPMDNDCMTDDSLAPQSVELSRRFAKLYILLLKWFKCRFVVFCKCQLNTNDVSCRGSSMPRGIRTPRRR